MRVLPDGCLDLVWNGQHARAVRPAAGPVRHPLGGGMEATGIRIRPGWAALVLGLPLRHTQHVTDLGDLWDPAAARCLGAALSAAPTAAARREILTRAIAGRLAQAAEPDPEVLGAVQVLGQPAASVGYAARCANLSARQLRRRFDDHVGLPPKTLHAILRFQRLRAWLASPNSGVATLARGAADCGYFDHAHLCRECRRLADLTPGTLLAALAHTHKQGTRTSRSKP
jgi:AraC-like DNA-binding protein